MTQSTARSMRSWEGSNPHRSGARRLNAVGYALVNDLGHVGVRVSAGRECVVDPQPHGPRRCPYSANHLPLDATGLPRGREPAAATCARPTRTDRGFSIQAEDEPFVSYRAIVERLCRRMSARPAQGRCSGAKRDRFIRYDEKRDRIWAGGALYVLIDRARMAEFVVELARRLGTGDAAVAVEQESG